MPLDERAVRVRPLEHDDFALEIGELDGVAVLVRQREIRRGLPGRRGGRAILRLRSQTVNPDRRHDDRRRENVQSLHESSSYETLHNKCPRMLHHEGRSNV